MNAEMAPATAKPCALSIDAAAGDLHPLQAFDLARPADEMRGHPHPPAPRERPPRPRRRRPSPPPRWVLSVPPPPADEMRGHPARQADDDRSPGRRPQARRAG